ncbi:MAG: hypothetical protein LBT40_01595 [Deltaproteobacteria bacterium]|jgi:hypothetical protein|nr:hypothetical protein [Deltaproteobacteria bacterium]
MKYKIPTLSLLVPLLAAFLGLAALPALAQVPPSWSTYSSADDPRLKDFGELTARYPPWFTATGAAEADSEAGRAAIDIAAGESKDGGHQYKLTAVIMKLTPETAQSLDKANSEEIWRALGNDLRSDRAGAYSGTRPLLFKGLHAADMDQSSQNATRHEGDTPKKAVTVNRLVISGLRLYMGACTVFGMTERETKFKGFSSRSIPTVSNICTPFLNSLELGHHTGNRHRNSGPTFYY